MTAARQPLSDPATVHRGLLAIARERKADFNAILTQYAIERLIDRLSRSTESPRFVLKGAMLFRIWTGELHRPTKDVDFLGHGAPSLGVVRDAVRTIVSVEHDDGLRFATESILAEEIREEQDYYGVRVSVTAYLAHVPITVRLDVGFGDVVTPEAAERLFPTLLGHDPPSILAYPPETSIAEKVEAMCKLGIINSRMKDYHDVILISRRFGFSSETLARAFRATFERRNTPLPSGTPTGLSEQFGDDDEKRRQWNAYVKRMGIDDLPMSLSAVISEIQKFVLPALGAAAGVAPLPGQWSPASGWSQRRG
jgi:AraC-like DNA-binding protein